MKKLVVYIASFSLTIIVAGQDPHFSQFFMAPQLINPSSVGTGSSTWRTTANYRQQWANVGTPFTTVALSTDWKMHDQEENSGYLGAGFTLLSDQSMSGAFKSVYANGSLAYHANIGVGEGLGLALQCAYGNRTIDYSQLTFGEQFTSGGFDVNLPTGEAALSKMKPFISVGAGLIYNVSHDYLNLDLGVAAFHMNRPRQTFVEDDKQLLPVRYTAHANLDYVLSDLVVVNFSSVFQMQARQNYISGGGTLGYDISGGQRKNMFFAGGWYRVNDAAYPYVGLLIGNLQIGLSYDVTVSKQKQSLYSPRSFELSLMFRGFQKEGVIPCPWK